VIQFAVIGNETRLLIYLVLNKGRVRVLTCLVILVLKTANPRMCLDAGLVRVRFWIGLEIYVYDVVWP